MSRFGIFGVGAIGSVLAGILNDSGEPVRLFTRRPLSRVRITVAGKTLDFSANSEQEGQITAPPPSWLFVCLKLHQYPAALPFLRKVTGKETRLILVRNGLHHGEELHRHFPENALTGALIDAPTESTEEGYRCRKIPELTLSREAGIKLQEVLGKTELTWQFTDDFHTDSWKKLLRSAPTGALMALYERPAELFREREYLHHYRLLLKEALAVARADGARIEPVFETQCLEEVKHYPPDKGSSMLQDKLAKRPLELDAKNGIISRLGKTYGIATPENDRMVSMLSRV